MTTLSEKDERLARQADEIESLNRKVESLERELARFLDPDSGELNPSITLERQKSKAQQYADYKANGGTMTMEEWENDSRFDPSLAGDYRYHFKTGEGALLEKIQTLERQLSDCLEDSPETIRFRTDLAPSRALESLITNVGASVFQPLEYYDENRDNRKVKDDRYGAWSMLVFVLIERPEFMDLWGNTHFRRSVNMINEVTTYLRTAQLKDDEAAREYRIAAEYLCIGPVEDHEAIKTLRIVLERLYKIQWDERDIQLDTEEIDYLIFSLQIIIQLQRLYLTMDMNRRE